MSITQLAIEDWLSLDKDNRMVLRTVRWALGRACTPYHMVLMRKEYNIA
jgi:hypothetical protein